MYQTHMYQWMEENSDESDKWMSAQAVFILIRTRISRSKTRTISTFTTPSTMTVEASGLTMNPLIGMPSITVGEDIQHLLVCMVGPTLFNSLIILDSYQSATHQKYGPLRAINGDRAQAHTGFDIHSHRETDIFSYVVSGEPKEATKLTRKSNDSLGNVEVLKRGDIQMTSVGSGTSHAEHAMDVHFLQI